MTLFERAVAQFQVNLPLLLAAGLAGFSWWLVQSTPKEVTQPRPARVSTQADYELFGATVAHFDDQGRLQAVIDGEAMRHYPVNDEIKIDRMVLSARDPKGQGLHAVANAGYANQMAREVLISGGAKIVATPAPSTSGSKTGTIRLLGESFHINTQTHVLMTDQPVTVLSDVSKIDAQGLRHDQRTGVTELKGRVLGEYSEMRQP